MKARKTIALVAHDNRKKDLMEWVEWNCEDLLQHKIVCTGTTGKLVEATIKSKQNACQIPTSDFSITRLKSGPLGGDQQLGAMIAEGKIDIMVFLWDPMEPHPHDVDVKALLRIAAVYNIPMACNRSSADFIFSSPLMNEPYEPTRKNYDDYVERKLGI